MDNAARSLLTELPIESLIDAVYDAALDPRHWRNVCELFQAMVAGCYVSISTTDLATNRSVRAYYVGHDDASYQTYKELYDRENPLIGAMRNRPVGVPFRLDQIVSPSVLFQTRFYNEWLKPQNDLTTGGIFSASNQQHRLVLFAALLPSTARAETLTRVMDILQAISPHVSRSLRLNHSASKVTNKASVLETFMEGARAAFLVLDEEGRPLETNRQARRLFDAGVLELDLAGVVVMKDPEGSAYIRNAVLEANQGTNDFGEGMPIAIEGQSSPAFLRAIPLGSQGKEAFHQLLGTRSGAVVIISIASSQPMLDAAQIRYGLSPAEAAVLRGLVDGKDLKELAAERQTSVNTVRNQVSSLLDKTSTSSQRELIGLFAGTRRI